MLRGRSSGRLDRRKSTASIRTSDCSKDNELARQHAQLAAITTSLPNQPPNSDKQQFHTRPLSTTRGQSVKRKQSIRFVGAHSQGRTNDAFTVVPPKGTDYRAAADQEPIALTTSTAVPAIYRPPSRSSSVGKGSLTKTAVSNLSSINHSFDDFYSPAENIPSTPSSYRRIRKSKSMISPLKASGLFSSNTAFLNARPSIGVINCYSRPDKSQHDACDEGSICHIRTESTKTAADAYERDRAAVQSARDRFFAQQRLREQSSFMSRTGTQRQETSFRKSMRSSGAESHGLPALSKASSHGLESKRVRSAALKASRSVRSKLKRMFTKNREAPQIPEQQVAAKVTHVQHHFGEPYNTHDRHVSSFQEYNTSSSKLTPALPSIHKAISAQQLRPYAGSVRSTHSLKRTATYRGDGDVSATSWNGSAANTISSSATRSDAGEELPQHLSTIKENRVHVAPSNRRSTTVGRKDLQADERRGSGMLQAVPLNIGPVDSARVYSALLKRLDGTDNVENKPFGQASVPLNTSRTNAGLMRLRKARSEATIRCVSSESQVHVNSPNKKCLSSLNGVPFTSRCLKHKEYDYQQDETLLPPKEILEGLDEAKSDICESPNKENIPFPAKKPLWQHSRHGIVNERQIMSNVNRFSHQEIAMRNEPVLPDSKILKESRSTFFGATSTIAMSRTPSPFRRALIEVRRNARHEEPNTATSQSQLRNPLMLADFPSIHAAQREAEVADSESVYSRTTSGRTAAVVQTWHNRDESNSIVQLSPEGDAVILNRATYRPIMPTSREHRSSSSTGSIEWKRWMSSEIEKLEQVKEKGSSSKCVNYALPSMPKSFHLGHLRENAQVDDDDTSCASAKFAPSPGLANIEQKYPSGPNSLPIKQFILRKDSASPLVELNSGNKIPLSTNVNAPPPPPPPLPPLLLRQLTFSMPSRAQSEPKAPNSIAGVAYGTGQICSQRPNAAQMLESATSPGNSARRVRDSCRARSKSPKSVHSTMTSSLRHNEPEQNRSLPGRLAISSECNEGEQSHELYGKKWTPTKQDPRGATAEMSVDEAQSFGSQRMVDIFLTSRRRRIASNSEDGCSQAFI